MATTRIGFLYNDTCHTNGAKASLTERARGGGRTHLEINSCKERLSPGGKSRGEEQCMCRTGAFVITADCVRTCPPYHFKLRQPQCRLKKCFDTGNQPKSTFTVRHGEVLTIAVRIGGESVSAGNEYVRWRTPHCGDKPGHGLTLTTVCAQQGKADQLVQAQ